MGFGVEGGESGVWSVVERGVESASCGMESVECNSVKFEGCESGVCRVQSVK